MGLDYPINPLCTLTFGKTLLAFLLAISALCFAEHAQAEDPCNAQPPYSPCLQTLWRADYGEFLYEPIPLAKTVCANQYASPGTRFIFYRFNDDYFRGDLRRRTVRCQFESEGVLTDYFSDPQAIEALVYCPVGYEMVKNRTGSLLGCQCAPGSLCAPRVCPTGQTLNPTTHTCEAPPPQCPAGETYNPATGACDCAPGQTRHPSTQVCEDPPTYRIRLSNPAGSSGAVTLAEVAPGNAIGVLATVINQRTGEAEAGVPVKVEVEVTPTSGGHRHHDDDRPPGSLNGSGKVTTGTTTNTGFPITFAAPAPAGEHKLKASCTDRTCTQEGPNVIEVKVPDLVPLGASSLYGLIGDTGDHPDNHYLTLEARVRATQLAKLYHEQFPDDPVLQYNDASLEWGGVFDIYFNYVDNNGTPHTRVDWWTPPHKEHRRGTVIDVRANNLSNAIPKPPKPNRAKFEKLVGDIGGNFLHESIGGTNEHYHVRLLGESE